MVSLRHFTENRVNNAAYTRSAYINDTTDSSGNTVTTLPTITENRTQDCFGSDLSEVSHTSISSSETPYGKKKFQVTHIKDPVPQTMDPSDNGDTTTPSITENKTQH
jgi:hypothetical protein